MGYRRNNGGLDMSGLSGKGRSYSKRASQQSSGLSFAKSAKYSKSVTRPKQGKALKKTSHVKKPIIMVIAIVIASLALATFVGIIVFKQTLKNSIRPNIDTQSLSQVLVKPSDNATTFWCAFSETDAQSSLGKRGTPKNFALCFCDTEQEELTFLWIPINARIYLEGTGYLRLQDLFEQQQESGVVQALSSLAGVDIAHYFEFSETGLIEYAKNEANLTLPDSAMSKNKILSALLTKIVGSSSEELNNQTQLFNKYFASDFSESDLNALFVKLQGMDVDENCRFADMPFTTQTDNSVDYAVVESSAWKTMVERVANGMSPVASAKEIESNKALRATSKVTIWNGAGVTGIAADCVKQIKKLGWSIKSSGNAAQFVYDETLIVYKNDSYKKAAKLLVSDLGQGRAVPSAFRYSFKGDLLVVVGKDYMPY